MAAYLPPQPIIPVLFAEAPTVEHRGGHYYVTDMVDGTVVGIRAYPEVVFLRAFQRGAQAIQDRHADVHPEGDVICFPGHAA